ncbi:hypothetical protein [Shahe hepe-like virus 2]|uniref:hypothetical protein n=1 Tax=Shahe hepe-like virus 2 TaxID=1923416 RepID=UPI00090B78C8|nr:hypothetical protein [Shahe hepe-like virus 2]APG77716.1 hypothetical protein [Shahe hepe-like virus 2]
MDNIDFYTPSTYGVLDGSTCPTSAAQVHIDKFWDDLYSDRLSKIVDLPWEMDNETLILLNQIFAPRILRPGAASVMDNGHVIPATAHFLAEQYLSRINGIEFGAQFNKVLTATTQHYCNLMTGRDQARLLTSMVENPTITNYQKGMSLYRGNGCTNGVENCTEPSFVLKANDVIYDISPKMMPRIFAQHKTFVGYFTILLPRELLMGISGTNPTLRYHFEKTNGNILNRTQARMTFFDQSHGYEHDYKTWRDWALLDGVRGPYFNLTIERYRKIGPLTVIRMARVEHSLKLHHFTGAPMFGYTEVINFLPILREMSKWVQSHIPIRNFMIKRWKKQCQKMYIPTAIISKTFQFLWNRKDTDVSRNHAGSMITAATTQIKISEFFIQHGVDISNTNFDDLATLLFIQALIQRAMASKDISFFIKKIHQARAGFWEKISNDFLICFEPINFLTTTEERYYRDVHGMSLNHIVVYALLMGKETNFDDHIVHTKLKGHKPIVKKVTPPKKTFHYDPPSDGWCLASCLLKLTLHSFHAELGPDCDLTSAETILNRHGYTLSAAADKINVEIDCKNGHATFIADTDNFCKHSVPFMPICIKQTTGKFAINKATFDYTKVYLEESEDNKNFAKTSYVMDVVRRPKLEPVKKFGFTSFKDKAKILNLAAAPFNDEEYWEKCKLEVVHNVVQTEGVSYHEIPYENVVFGINVCCSECMQEISGAKFDFIYADIGNNVPLDRQASFYTKALLNIQLTGAQFVLKVPSFGEMISKSNCDEFIEILHQFAVIKNELFAAGEVIITNQGPIRYNGFPYQAVFQEFFQQPIKITDKYEFIDHHKESTHNHQEKYRDFTPTMHEDLIEYLNRPMIGWERAKTNARGPKQQTPPSAPPPEPTPPSDDDDDEMPPSAPPMDTIVEEDESEPMEEETINEMNEEEDGNCFIELQPLETPEYYAKLREEALTEASKAREAARQKDKEFFDNAERLGLIKPSLRAREKDAAVCHCGNGEELDTLCDCGKQVHRHCVKICPLASNDYRLILVDYKEAELALQKMRLLNPNLASANLTLSGKLYFDDKEDATYNALCGVVAGENARITGVDIATAVQLTSICKKVVYRSKKYEEVVFTNEKLFDLPLADFEMPKLSSRFYGKGGDLEDIEGPEVPFAIYRGDIPNLKGKYRDGVFQIPDITSGCNKCIVPTFDGLVVGVRDNTVFGPRRKVPLLPFTEIVLKALPNAIGADKMKLYRELEKTVGKFAEPHKEAAAVVLKTTWKPEVKIQLVEGTAASGKSSMCKTLLKGIIDMVICPTAALAKEYRDDGFDAVSWAMGISNATGKKVLIDEVFAFDQAALWQIASTATITYAVGDRHQMIGGDKDAIYLIPELRKQVPFDKIAKRMVSFTVPHDIVTSVNLHNPDPKGMITTQSRILNSIVVHDTRPPAICGKKEDKKDKGVCSNGHAKKKQCNQGACFDRIHATRMKMPTVATIQGLRSREFHLFMSSSCKQLVNAVHGQKFVSLTRHTHALHIYQAVPTLSSLMAIRPILLDHSCGIGRRDAHLTVYNKHTDIVNAHVYMTLNKDFDINNVEPIMEEVPVGDIIKITEGIAEVHYMKPKPEPKAFTLNHKVTGKTRIEKLASMPDEHDYEFGVPASYMINQFMTGYDTLDVDMPTELDIESFEAAFNDEMTYQPMRMSPLVLGSTLAASEELMKIAPTVSVNYETNRHILHTEMRPIIDKRIIMLKQHKRSLAQRDSKKTFVSISPAFGIQQDNSLNHQLHTMIERYGANVQETAKGAEAIRQFEELKNGFMKFVDVEKMLPMTLDDVALKEVAALQKIQAKERYPDMEPFGTTYESTEKIACFNKKQLKAKIGENSFLGGKKAPNGKFYIKGGQPVSAQSKAVNQIAMKFILAAEEIVMNACKPGVFFGYGHSRREFRRIVSKRLRRQKNFMKFAKTCSADITEQDTNKGPWTDLFMRWIYEKCGVPTIVIDIIEKLNIHWVLHALDAKTRVKYRYQSGRADTIFANTCMAIGVAGMSFDFDHLITALFQGDDINIKAVGLKTASSLYNKLKLDWNKIGDFVGFLISDEDIYLDIPRIAAKNMTRMVDDKRILDDYVTATKDLLNLHNNPQDKYKNVMIAAAKYGTSTSSMEIIYEYLVAFASSEVIADLKADKFGKRSPEYAEVDTITLLV